MAAAANGVCFGSGEERSVNIVVSEQREEEALLTRLTPCVALCTVALLVIFILFFIFLFSLLLVRFYLFLLPRKVVFISNSKNMVN